MCSAMYLRNTMPKTRSIPGAITERKEVMSNLAALYVVVIYRHDRR